MTLMRNGRDRRLGKPGMGHATLERVFLFGTRSADHIRASGHGGRVVMGPVLHSKTGRIHGCTRTLRGNVRFFLHRGRRPYMAHRFTGSLSRTFLPSLELVRNTPVALGCPADQSVSIHRGHKSTSEGPRFGYPCATHGSGGSHGRQLVDPWRASADNGRAGSRPPGINAAEHGSRNKQR